MMIWLHVSCDGELQGQQQGPCSSTAGPNLCLLQSSTSPDFEHFPTPQFIPLIFMFPYLLPPSSPVPFHSFPGPHSNAIGLYVSLLMPVYINDVAFPSFFSCPFSSQCVEFENKIHEFKKKKKKKKDVDLTLTEASCRQGTKNLCDIQWYWLYMDARWKKIRRKEFVGLSGNGLTRPWLPLLLFTLLSLDLIHFAGLSRVWFSDKHVIASNVMISFVGFLLGMILIF